jgi:non-lysosomal glucosylceramidase
LIHETDITFVARSTVRPRRIVRELDVPYDLGRHIALPLGGIGTGNVALCADGALRQWQLHNIGNHLGTLPHSFFAVRVSSVEPPSDVTRILQAPTPPAEATHTPLVNDDHIPEWQRANLETFGGVAETRFSATYPFARVRYLDPALPVDITLDAFTPLVPFDVERSSLPAALFMFTLENTSELAVHGTLAGTLQNAVGWDGVSPIEGVSAAGYGGNVNRLCRRGGASGGWTSVLLENPGLAPDHPGAGQLLLSADDGDATALLQWTRPEEFFAYLGSRGVGDVERNARVTGADWRRTAPASAVGPSPVGQTWNAGLGVPFQLAPGERRTVRIVLSWLFPNRYLNFDQFGPAHPDWDRSRFWLGNAYTSRFDDVREVLRLVDHDWDELHDLTASWTSTMAESSLDDTMVDRVAAQLAYLRSPTCFQGEDGRFYGFEGVLGASTPMWNGTFGGSCPLNCTHVWNYEQVVAKLFPELERNMRNTEFEVMQAPEGYLPHRLIAPAYLPQLWDTPIGGPDDPALDGMLGAVLKTYREVRHGAGLDWLARHWPRVVQLLDHVDATWNVGGSGLLRGIQPSTHDIDLRGINSYMGTLWLAALRAAEEMARLLGEEGTGQRYRRIFDEAGRAYDSLLFNGDYYVQLLDEGDAADFAWGEGCLADQLIGQWWAHELDLGYVLPADHVRTALRSIVKHNLRTGFDELEHGYRVFADGDDTGLLLCTWPRGGRPAVPVRYADEVWTGIEYQVAAHCFREGLAEEGRLILDGLWARYDGSRRNPYNEIECGDHYVRAMAGWSVLEAITGYQYDAITGVLRLGVAEVDEVVPFVTDRAWATVRIEAGHVEVSCRGGELRVNTLVLEGLLTVTDPIALGPGETLRFDLAATPQSPHPGLLDATLDG